MMMQSVSRHINPSTQSSVQIKPLSEAIKTSTIGGYGERSVLGSSSRVQGIETITVATNQNIHLRDVMEAAKDSVAHPLEDVDMGMMNDLQLPLLDRLRLKIWCLKGWVTPTTVHKLETKKAQEAVKKIKDVLLVYENDISRNHNALGGLDKEINTTKYNLNNALNVKATNVRVLRAQLARLVKQQVKIEDDIVEKERLIKKGEVYIKMFTSQEQGLDRVIMDYTSGMSGLNLDKAIEETDDNLDTMNNILDYRRTQSEMQGELFIEEGDDFASRVDKRLHEILHENEVSFSIKDYQKIVKPKPLVVKPAVVDRRNDDNDDDDDTSTGMTESANLLPVAPDTKIQQMATEMQLEHIKKTALMI